MIRARRQDDQDTLHALRKMNVTRGRDVVGDGQATRRIVKEGCSAAPESKVSK